VIVQVSCGDQSREHGSGLDGELLHHTILVTNNRQQVDAHLPLQSTVYAHCMLLRTFSLSRALQAKSSFPRCFL
jgi:hypothetical protein